MPQVVALSKEAIITAVKMGDLKYQIDGDGDVKIGVYRKKGKDINVYAMTGGKRRDILQLMCTCPRWFKADDLAKIVIFCNEWNRERLMPRAYVGGPDNDGDFHITLDYALFCEKGIHLELLEDIICNFAIASDLFWDKADEEI